MVFASRVARGGIGCGRPTLVSPRIARRRAAPDWETRRGWDIHSEADLRLEFGDRVALVLDRLDANSTAFRDTMGLYGQRNRTAHGRSLETGIDVPTIIDTLYKISRELTP